MRNPRRAVRARCGQRSLLGHATRSSRCRMWESPSPREAPIAILKHRLPPVLGQLPAPANRRLFRAAARREGSRGAEKGSVPPGSPLRGPRMAAGRRRPHVRRGAARLKQPPPTAEGQPEAPGPSRRHRERLTRPPALRAQTGEVSGM